MNHEIICKFCDKDQRLHGLDCCEENEALELQRRIIEEKNAATLKNILNHYNITTYYNGNGGIIIPKSEIKKLVNLLG